MDTAIQTAVSSVSSAEYTAIHGLVEAYNECFRVTDGIQDVVGEIPFQMAHLMRPLMQKELSVVQNAKQNLAQVVPSMIRRAQLETIIDFIYETGSDVSKPEALWPDLDQESTAQSLSPGILDPQGERSGVLLTGGQVDTGEDFDDQSISNLNSSEVDWSIAPF